MRNTYAITITFHDTPAVVTQEVEAYTSFEAVATAITDTMEDHDRNNIKNIAVHRIL